MKKLLVTRTYQGTNTLGQIEVLEDGNVIETYYTLELPYKDNERRVSCIPTGIYQIKKHLSPKFGLVFWIQDVPNRSEILIHPANYTRQLLGCIAVGMDHKDIDGDGEFDVVQSRSALVALLKHDINEIEIIEI
jgi:hypothetical protein